MSEQEDYDDEPGRRQRFPLWLLLVILFGAILLIPTMLFVLFIAAFAFSNM